jgi:lipopolysaccharide transport system permease protein
MVFGAAPPRIASLPMAGTVIGVTRRIDQRRAMGEAFIVPEDSRQRVSYMRDLLRELVVRDMKLRYKRSVLGILWSLLQPLAQLTVYVFVFGRVLNLDIPNYPSFVFVGVLAYNWFQAALHQSVGAITDNRELIKRPGFPVAILPVASVTTNLVHFLLALPILLLTVLLVGGRVTGAFLALPLIMALQFLLILSLGYFLATFQVTFRDTQHLLGVFLMLFFFLTPIFYHRQAIPPQYQFVYQVNPMTHLITAYRTVLLDGDWPSLLPLLIVAVFSLGLLWLGHRFFVRASHSFAEEL